MKQNHYIFLLLGLLFACSSPDKPVPEPQKGILHGRISIRIPTISEDGVSLNTIEYMSEIDGLQILTSFNEGGHRTYSMDGKYSLLLNYGDYFLFYQVTDSILRDFIDMPFPVNKDSIVADCIMTPKYNSKSNIMKIEHPFANPVVSSFNLKIDLSEDGLCEIKIVDLLGISHGSFYNNTLRSGSTLVSWSGNLPKKGIYFVFAKFNNRCYSYAAFYYDKK